MLRGCGPCLHEAYSLVGSHEMMGNVLQGKGASCNRSIKRGVVNLTERGGLTGKVTLTKGY